MNGSQIRNTCKPISDDLNGISITTTTNQNALSDSPVYCAMEGDKELIVFNTDKLADFGLLQKPVLLMFVVEHEIQHFGDNSLMADIRFDRQALQRLIDLEIDITQINEDDYATLLGDDAYKVDRVNQLSNYINNQRNNG